MVLGDFDILRKRENFVRAIISEFMSRGFRNRGVKCREDLYVFNKTKMIAILVEHLFCHSEIHRLLKKWEHNVI
ncbi:N-acetylmuramoyl-L-alanine amidase [Clostridium tunisiense]|uniref:N-acetylmuramoyl-L-alanine amidase n=1 Tax=Clostridium tunisiense TaxID=219748 RepID=UPI000301B161|nr:N-acetylmuramoyl-L-alanine amidase [Clostridium tunisiense]